MFCTRLHASLNVTRPLVCAESFCVGGKTHDTQYMVCVCEATPRQIAAMSLCTINEIRQRQVAADMYRILHDAEGIIYDECAKFSRTRVCSICSSCYTIAACDLVLHLMVIYCTQLTDACVHALRFVLHVHYCCKKVQPVYKYQVVYILPIQQRLVCSTSACTASSYLRHSCAYSNSRFC